MLDIYRQVAANIFDVSYVQVTEVQRREAKDRLLQCLYGGGSVPREWFNGVDATVLDAIMECHRDADGTITVKAR